MNQNLLKAKISRQQARLQYDLYQLALLKAGYSLEKHHWGLLVEKFIYNCFSIFNEIHRLGFPRNRRGMLAFLTVAWARACAESAHNR